MHRVVSYKEYTTCEGDTFDALALEMYGDENLSHYIIEFNPDYADVLIFDANCSLLLPVIENIELANSLPPWRQSEEAEN